MRIKFLNKIKRQFYKEKEWKVEEDVTKIRNGDTTINDFYTYEAMLEIYVNRSGTFTYPIEIFDYHIVNFGNPNYLHILNEENKPIYFQVEDWDINKNYAKIQIKFNNVQSGNKLKYRILYGGYLKENKYYNPYKIFDYFDNFENFHNFIKKYEIDNLRIGIKKLLSIANNNLQGLTTDGTFLYIAKNNGKQINGTIFKVNFNGEIISTFECPPHGAGGTYNYDNDTLIFSSGGSEEVVLQEIDKNTGNVLNKQYMGMEGFKRGALVAYAGNNNVFLFTSRSNNDFIIEKYKLLDNGHFERHDIFFLNQNLGEVPQGMYYSDSIIYILAGVSKAKILAFNEKYPNREPYVIELPIKNEEPEGLTFLNNKFIFGTYNGNIYETDYLKCNLPFYLNQTEDEDKINVSVNQIMEKNKLLYAKIFNVKFSQDNNNDDDNFYINLVDTKNNYNLKMYLFKTNLNLSAIAVRYFENGNKIYGKYKNKSYDNISIIFKWYDDLMDFYYKIGNDVYKLGSNENFNVLNFDKINIGAKLSGAITNSLVKGNVNYILITDLYDISDLQYVITNIREIKKWRKIK